MTQPNVETVRVGNPPKKGLQARKAHFFEKEGGAGVERPRHARGQQ